LTVLYVPRWQVWFQDLGRKWFFVSKCFIDYFRLLVMHLGLPNWHYAFTEVRWVIQKSMSLYPRPLSRSRSLARSLSLALSPATLSPRRDSPPKSPNRENNLPVSSLHHHGQPQGRPHQGYEPFLCRVDMAHTRQSRPDSGLGLLAKEVQTFSSCCLFDPKRPLLRMPSTGVPRS